MPTIDPDAASVLVGTIVGAGIATLGSWLTTRQQTDSAKMLDESRAAEQRRIAMTERVGQFLAATYHGITSLRQLALAESELKSTVEKVEVWPIVDRLNSALVAIEVNDPEDVVDTARRIDRAVYALSKAAGSETFTQESWRAKRQEHMANLPVELKQIVRQHATRLQAGILS
ncbi:hypothetical protein [Promicromonospora soli]|uniref:Uncharacterized protein n=1 Tax=Promicromonospora soli TaxID=2035533 RepID=A0A919FIG4_9MICO|nr:hypothetical protein [Promicromonospora soli]GHH66293.1 hypothetical protein GCM10017772_05990 [Promicromonospora soli]